MRHKQTRRLAPCGQKRKLACEPSRKMQTMLSSSWKMQIRSIPTDTISVRRMVARHERSLRKQQRPPILDSAVDSARQQPQQALASRLSDSLRQLLALGSQALASLQSPHNLQIPSRNLQPRAPLEPQPLARAASASHLNLPPVALANPPNHQVLALLALDSQRNLLLLLDNQDSQLLALGSHPNRHRASGRHLKRHLRLDNHHK